MSRAARTDAARPTRRPTAGPGQFTLTLIDRAVNLLFGTTYATSTIRRQLLIIAIFVTWMVVAFFSHPIADWQTALFNVLDPPPGTVAPLFTLIRTVLVALIAPDVLGHMIAILFPFWLALRIAAIFLDDIFELKDAAVAAKFLTRAAFVFPTFGVMNIENGQVRPRDQKSTIFRIGGPGSVRVMLENVAIFERIDGTARLIGPTDQPGYLHTLDGFERLRRIIDLRDLTLQMDLTGRTKDGIPIKVQNIRLLFSVVRLEKSSNTAITRPYPYSGQAILRLAYDQGDGPWTTSITGLVRSELISFIGEHTLGEIFSSVGDPEIQRQIQSQSTLRGLIQRPRRRLAAGQPRRFVPLGPAARKPATSLRFLSVGPGGKFPRRRNIPRRPGVVFASPTPAPTLFPRPQLSRQFYQEFAERFPLRARQRGVRLEWIDIGAWHIPSSVVINQQMSAWQLTAENVIRSNLVVLQDLRSQGRAEELLRLLRRPLLRYMEVSRGSLDRDETAYLLIEEYLGQLRAARDQYMREGNSPPAALENAIQHIQRYQHQHINNRRGRYLSGPQGVDEPTPANS